MASAYPSSQPESFERLLKRIEPRLKAVLGRHRIPPQDAEDLLQQALLAYLYKKESIHEPEAWLLGTLRNRCLMYWRSKRRKLYEAVDTSLLESIAEPRQPRQEAKDLSRDLDQLIGRLPEKCRNLLRLRYGLGCPAPEAAKRLGYRSSSIYKIMERCLAALTRHMVQSGMIRDRDSTSE